MTRTDQLEFGWWLASRAAGILALVLMTASVVIGLLLATGLARTKPGLPKKLVGIHEHAALCSLVAIAVHGIALLGDGWMRPGITGIAVPFVLDYKPVFTGVGIISGYIAAALGLSFYARRKIGPKVWRKLHKLIVVAWAGSMVHALGSGTDASSPWFRWLAVALATPVLFLFVYRLLPAEPRRQPQVAS
jgi:methionine sulfoxide reductase heme-binding subunit